MAKMYNNQTFNVGSAQWKYEQGATPQGTMTARAKDGAQLAGIIPYDWGKPIDAPNNAVLFTRSLSGNDWKSSPPTDLKSAIKKGSNHIGSYHQDRQVSEIEQFFKNKDKQANQNHQATNSKEPPSLAYESNSRIKPLKGRAALKAMQRATDYFQDGAEHRAKQQAQNKDRGMGD